MNDQKTTQSQPLIEFLRLESSARSAQTIGELGFVMVNETHRLIPYRQAFFCSVHGNSINLETISGLAGIDRHSPFYDWFSSLCKHFIQEYTVSSSIQLTADEIPDRIRDEWHQWLPGYLLSVPLRNRNGETLALLMLAREDSFTSEEQQTIEALFAVYAHALSALYPSSHFTFKRLAGMASTRRFSFILIIIIILALFLPVRQSTLGPAEVTPQIYNSIAAPLDGVIATIPVKPNAKVKKNDVLFRLDDTTIRNRLESANRTMGVAKSEEFTSRQKSFIDPQSRSEVATQEARVKEKGSTIHYMRELLGKMDVRAPADGIVLFSDPSDWEGKPVATGERVMILADEKSAGITIWLPAADAVALEPGRRVRFFLHSDPMHPADGTIVRTSYQPVLSPDNIASYRITADFAAGTPLPRLGLKGTAKIYGDRVSLAYYLFRRPIAAVRQFMGW